MIDPENGREMIKCPYCGTIYHYIPGFQGEDGKPITYTIHVRLEEITRGIKRSSKSLTKIIKRINKNCRKIRRLLG
jgi:uncharacterized C2H2 Zn-finger protein